MRFFDDFNKTIGNQKPAAAPTPTQGPDTADLKAYIDSKFEGLRNEYDNKMKAFLEKNHIEEVTQVETPTKETVVPDIDNIKKEELNNGSNTDL